MTTNKQTKKPHSDLSKIMFNDLSANVMKSFDCVEKKGLDKI